MTDLEITKLCAEAMGEPVAQKWDDNSLMCVDGLRVWQYDPLHDDAQAMALVKKFKPMIDTYADGTWLVGGGWKNDVEVEGVDLNCAVCECIAQMQLARRNHENSAAETR